MPAKGGDESAAIMKRNMLFLSIFILISLFASGCAGGGGGVFQPVPLIVVNSLEDLANPSAGVVTLRSALAAANSGQTITFAASLNGRTIALDIVGEDHSILKGEVMGMRDEPSGPVSYLVGYFERDYGKSALYARKNVVIDASDLPSGITLSWAGGGSRARVLAVYGNLTMNNVSVTGGSSVAEDISTGNPDDQPWTLARGGAIAVWGIARLTDCRLYGNSCEGDFDSSRDRGAYGGGLYANIVEMTGCVVSGNTIVGAGAAGGGVYSEGGVDSGKSLSYVRNSSITGNRISAIMTYGGGVFSNGGGIGNRKTMELTSSTIARNLVNSPPGMPSFLLNMGYWRGGGAYISNGYLRIKGCTIVENEVYGKARTDSLGKPNLAGGVAATIGNAHAVESMTVGHSVIAGNTVHETGGATYENDIFTGSLLYFKSAGYNRIGVIDFSQILVPVGEPNWASLVRKHYPKQGDQDGIDIADVLDLNGGIAYSDSILSAGVDAPDPAVLYYNPRGSALGQVPYLPYTVYETFGEYSVASGATDNFLAIMLDRLESHYGLPGFAADFQTDFDNFLQAVDLDTATAGNQPYTDPDGNPILTLADTHWFGPAVTWPRELYNHPYIHFWHRLDAALLAENIPGMGPELLGDDAWRELFSSGPLAENPNIRMTIMSSPELDVSRESGDQLGNPKPVNAAGDIGAIELP
jgi:hypothetical protein